ncbi:single-stranded-DNA-specific exonuclease RecJ [Psychromonas sp. psych-6C06]|uniref:single-stranded-DNA-specific exonuclease RecJ n=1 Tax=Psychromonas sp. psych-6C06 TaxID=2058089 RepID=UPI000C3448F9|nr:single-stranded-DNA-specific exonuclease RecJ [Psychromonas sp. psych-6C06]PKF63030.1 single-stranded-DNA-specific exonuclease RecJ [Psychromonas sp. psych-6C06]
MSSIAVKKRTHVDASFLNFPCSPLLKQLYANRGICSDHELDNSTKTLLSAKQLKGIDAACALLYDALLSHKKIVVVGDFDADGATSTALSMLAFKALGFIAVDYIVPNRFDYGYGLTPETVDLARAKGAEIIMTVDNGISSNSGVAHAKQLGMQVLVTDHHLPGETLPDADAIVNPNQVGCDFPSKHLAGVGVAFYLMLALRAYLSEKGYFTQQGAPNLACLLDIVALGTVADVVQLDANNRTLVQQGLARIRAGICRPGISALISVAKRNQAQLVASDLGFSLGPRLNAAGRLDEMSYGVELLLCDDPMQANIMANELDALNQSRREIEQGMQQEALATLAGLELDESNIPHAICLFDPQWHQGVIGLVASRIKERYYRPTFVFAKGNEGEIKASARSIPGIHIRDILDLVDKRIPNVILKFGGHAMAAGLSIKASDFNLFRENLITILAEQIDEAILTNVLLSDGQLSAQQINIEQAQELREAGPWGQAFPAPLFDGEFTVLQQRLVGEKHLKMVLSSEGKSVDAIAFNVDLKAWPNPMVKKVFCVYRLDVNEFRGNRTVQLLVELLKVQDKES